MFSNSSEHNSGEARRRRQRPARRRAGRPPVRPQVVPLEDRLLPSVFWVSNTNNDGPGSLHQAIEDANANPGTDTIAFDIEPGGPQTIKLTSPLPTVFDPVVIDGTSQAGWVSDPIITVDGSGLKGFYNGLTITADGCKVKGLEVESFSQDGIALYSNNNVIAGDHFFLNRVGVEIRNAASGNVIGGTTGLNRNVISGNSEGIQIWERSTGNLVEGNYIGTNNIGTAAFGNDIGVDIFGGASNNTVGGTAAGAGNLISGNNDLGVFIFSDASGILVQGNRIGTTAAGTAALANGVYGVRVAGASGNTVGGTPAGAGNLISGNSGAGLSIDNGATGNLVQGNKIGTNAAGTAALGNATNGVEISAASNNTVGGTAAGAGNLISGNTQDGILLTIDAKGNNATGNLVQGNKIGTDVTGTTALANGGHGVDLGHASNNTIGGTAAGAGNLISGNKFDGISFFVVTGNLVQGNNIGTNAAGTAALANGGSGVDLFASTGNTVGGVAAGAGNLISGNTSDGILIEGGPGGGQSTANLVQGNRIGTNAAGTAALGNAAYGVEIDKSSNNTVGGTAAGAGNLISGNSLDGILMRNGATANLVLGNRIGTNAAGTAAVANGGIGVQILGASNNTVGGTVAGAGNTISGNGGDGIFISSSTGVLVQGNKIGTNAAGTAAVANSYGVVIFGSGNTVGGTAAGAGNLLSGNSTDGVFIGPGTTANLVQGNRIGTNAAGTAAVANGFDGIEVQGSNNTIGGTVAGAGNTIAFNTANGVQVEVGTGNTIRRNSIFANGGLGIRLNPGANNDQPAPSLASARYDPFVTHTLTVKGTVTGAAGSRVTLEFFANPAGDPEGKVFLGALVVTIGANGTASFTFTEDTTALGAGMLITATATDPTNGTSQFSAGRTVT